MSRGSSEDGSGEEKSGMKVEDMVQWAGIW